jgi:hypothetical protein
MFDNKEYQRRWYQENKDRLKERHRAADRRWYHKNRKKKIEAMREWRKQNPEKFKAVVARWKEAHPEWRPKKPLIQKRAHWAVKSAKRNGTLKPQPCKVCGEKHTQAHHHDYTKPLDVVWLCARHHAEQHRHAETR